MTCVCTPERKCVFHARHPDRSPDEICRSCGGVGEVASGRFFGTSRLAVGTCPDCGGTGWKRTGGTGQ